MSSQPPHTSYDALPYPSLVCLGEAWPRAVPFADRPAQALARLGRGHDNAEAVRHDTLALARVLLTASANAGDNLVQLSLCPPRFTTEVSERPLASPLARLQAESAAQATNRRHELVNRTPFDRHLLPHLDGTRDRPSLLAALLERFRQGQLQIEEDGRPVAEEGRAERILAEVLDQQLPKLAAAALLISPTTTLPSRLEVTDGGQWPPGPGTVAAWPTGKVALQLPAGQALRASDHLATAQLPRRTSPA